MTDGPWSEGWPKEARHAFGRTIVVTHSDAERMRAERETAMTEAWNQKERAERLRESEFNANAKAAMLEAKAERLRGELERCQGKGSAEQWSKNEAEREVERLREALERIERAANILTAQEIARAALSQPTESSPPSNRCSCPKGMVTGEPTAIDESCPVHGRQPVSNEEVAGRCPQCGGTRDGRYNVKQIRSDRTASQSDHEWVPCPNEYHAPLRPVSNEEEKHG